MFLTHEMAKNKPMSAMYGTGLSVWHQIKLAGAEPFFLVEYATEEEGEQRTSTMLFSYINQVLQFTEKPSNRISQSRVMLVSPAWLNQADNSTWQMDELSEAWQGTIHQENEVVHASISRYVLSNGKIIDQQANDPSKKIEWTQIWKSKSASAAIDTKQ